jgi:hypothetical protein
MKMRRLPEIDLARIAPLEEKEQLVKLRSQKVANPPYNYNPLRNVVPDLLNAGSRLLGAGVPTPWSQIAKKIASQSRHELEGKVNLALAEILRDRIKEDALVGQSQDFAPLAIGISNHVRYWLRLSYLRNERLIVPFIDPRKQNSLGPAGRRFAFSMMNVAIREANPDFENASFEIWHFGRTADGSRTLNIYSDADVEFYSFEELDEMVRNTYAFWQKILEEREAEERRKAAGTKGPLGF